jgi:hypothetical protein
MSRSLAGVRADSKHSHRSLEKFAAYVRQQLNFAPDAAIDPLRLFEDLHEISISRADGTTIPLRGGVIALEDSEGYARYDRQRKVIEIPGLRAAIRAPPIFWPMNWGTASCIPTS